MMKSSTIQGSLEKGRRGQWPWDMGAVGYLMSTKRHVSKVSLQRDGHTWACQRCIIGVLGNFCGLR